MKKKAAACLGLGAVVLIGGSFAYYSQSASLENPMSTGHYTSQLVEEFTPPTEELKPGQKWDKTVGAENTGDYPVLVRVKMEEEWKREGENGEDVIFASLDSKNDKFTAGIYKDFIFDADQWDDTDGLTYAKEDETNVDGTVVYKNLLTKDSTSKWVAGGDGYWYWNGVLEKGDTTGSLMDYLVLANDIDLGYYTSKEYWAIADKGTAASNITDWTEMEAGKTILDIAEEQKGNIGTNQTLFRKSDSELDTTKKGYADANYTLTVTAEFVQATTDAVKASWCRGDESKYKKVKTALSNVTEQDGHLIN